jgi:ATP-dependent protease Clp ATPase subunit
MSLFQREINNQADLLTGEIMRIGLNTSNILFCCLWRGANDSWDNFYNRSKDAVSDGTETHLHDDRKEKAEAINAIEKYGLKIIGQNWQSITDTTEFGPIPDMVMLPFTQQPIADQ